MAASQVITTCNSKSQYNTQGAGA